MVLFSTGSKLGEYEIVLLQAKPGGLTSVLVLNRYQTSFPTCGQYCGLSPNPVGVIAVGVMEHAPLAQNAIYLVNLIVTMERVDIGLRREKQLPRSVWVLSQNCLAADDDDLFITGDVGRCADDVL